MKLLGHLLLFLASTDASATDLDDALLRLRRMPHSELMNRIRELRHIALLTRGQLDDERADVESTSNTRSPSAASFISDIIGMLRDQAKLPTRRIVAELSKSLLGSTRALPLRDKEGLRRWLQRLSEIKDPRLILQHAITIRNNAMHSTEGVWTLDDVRNQL